MPKLKANDLRNSLEHGSSTSNHLEKSLPEENEYLGIKNQQTANNKKLKGKLNIHSVQDPIDYQLTSILSKNSENVFKTKKFCKNKKIKMKAPPTETSSPNSLLLFEEPMTAINPSADAPNERLNKNRKTKNRKKKAKQVSEKCIPQNDNLNNRDYKCGNKTIQPSNNTPRYFSNPSKKSKLGRCVVFTNEVIVIHFNNERVIFESTEPLKKELDQQIRNKEMRKGCKFVN